MNLPQLFRCVVGNVHWQRYSLTTSTSLCKDPCDSSFPSVRAHAAAVSAGFRPCIPSACPQNWHMMISKCWNQDPAARPSFAQILTLFETFPEAGPKVATGAINEATVQGYIDDSTICN